MPFDSITTFAITHEIKHLEGAHIVKVYQPNKYTIVLKYHGTASRGRLIISAHPQNYRISLNEEQTENPSTPPLFCMVLRKYLEGGQLFAISQRPYERIVDFTVSYTNNIGDHDTCTLTAELMGKHSNIILVDKTGYIIDALRRYSFQVSRYRQVLPKEMYIPPPKQNGLDWNLLTEDNIAAALWQFPEETPLINALPKTINGISPFLAREIIALSNIRSDITCQSMGQYELTAIISNIKKISSLLDMGSFYPCVLEDDSGLKDFFALLPLQYNDGNLLQFDSMCEVLNYFYSKKEDLTLFLAQKRELIKVVLIHANRAKKKLSLQEADYQQAQEADTFKKYGDLLAANLYYIKPGDTTITVKDFYQDDALCEIKLDESFSAQENLRKYYQRYSKLNHALKLIAHQMTVSLQEVNYLESVIYSLERANSVQELEEIKNELRSEGYLKERHTKRTKIKNEKPLPPIEMMSSDEFLIIIGRNNRQNELLTFKMAAKNDLWLHVKNIPGSHVIINSGGKSIPDTTISRAAELAAWHSKARNTTKVSVDYTLIAHVKKQPGGKPGMVTYTNQKTIIIDPKE